MLALVALCGAIAAAPPAERPDVDELDYGLTVGLGLAMTAATFLIPRPPSGWKRGLLFDDLVLDVFEVDARTEEDTISSVSDVLQNALIAAPLVLDVGASALLAEGDAELAWDLLWIDLESMALSAALVVLTKRTFGRVRPNIPVCEGTDDDFSCRSPSSRRSFVSGHASASFTGAGLICAHHDFLELWGRKADAGACAGALAIAVAASLMRIPSDRHYPTDVLAGAAIGLVSGYVVPYLLHFSGPRASPDAPITGALALYASGGGVTAGDTTALAAGFDASLAHRVWLGPRPHLALHAGVDGRVYQSLERISVRQVAPWIGAWYRGAGLGFAMSYASVVKDGEANNALSVGPELRFGVLERDATIELAARWLPLGDGGSNQIAGRIDASLFSHFALRAEVQRVTGDGAATFTLGAGGRLPW